MLSQMTTPNTARDLDVIRAGLGERKLNYLGVSYGTYLGAVYADLFPGHLRRMIVDSVVNPSRDQIWYQNNLDQDVAFEGRWHDWQQWVATNDAVYHLGTTVAQVQAKWETLRATAKAHPIGGVVGPSELLGFFQNAPYYDSTWATVAGVFSRYESGDTQALVDAAGPDLSDTAGNISSENGNAVYTAVECTDAKWPADWRVWDRDNTALNARYPFLTWANAWLNLPCATWPVKQRTPVEVASHPGLPQVLIVQSTRDAATPYSGAVELHGRLAGSRMITEKDAGSHGVTGLVNPCINSRVDAYLLSGTLDAHDVVCGPHATPVPTAP
jgi:pimeloyl-ACP methyl ester carboxylesterase